MAQLVVVESDNSTQCLSKQHVSLEQSWNLRVRLFRDAWKTSFCVFPLECLRSLAPQRRLFADKLRRAHVFKNLLQKLMKPRQ